MEPLFARPSGRVAYCNAALTWRTHFCVPGCPRGPAILPTPFRGPTNRSVVTSSADLAGQPIASIHRSDRGGCSMQPFLAPTYSVKYVATPGIGRELGIPNRTRVYTGVGTGSKKCRF